MSFKVTTNRSAIRACIKRGEAAAIPVVSMQALKDCNYYCRQYKSTMISSSYSKSILKKGLLVWDTLYAKRMYFTGTPSKDVNANASLMWCDKAEKTYGKDWEAIFQRAFLRGMGH